MDLGGVSSPFLYMNECNQCMSAKNEGIEAFIGHLTRSHSTPTEWPSDRAAKLTGAAAKKPYTTVAATRKKRLKPTTPRPLNSFMIFAQHIRRNVLAIFDQASSSNVSRLLGDAWNRIPKGVRAAYDMEAARLSKIHSIEFPSYKYQPKIRHRQSVSCVSSVSPKSEYPVQAPPMSSSFISSSDSSELLPQAPVLSSTTMPKVILPPIVKSEAVDPPLPILSSLIDETQSSSKGADTTEDNSTKSVVTKSRSEHNPSSPCLSSSSQLTRTPSPVQQLTPMQENIVPSTTSTSSASTTDVEEHQRLSLNLTALNKQVKQESKNSPQIQPQLAQNNGDTKPCILLIPLQSEIGQQTVVSCVQTSTVPPLLTIGNTVYVALPVMQSTSTATSTPGNVQPSVIHVNSERPQAPSTVDSIPESALIRSGSDCPLANLLRAAAVAAAASIPTSPQ